VKSPLLATVALLVAAGAAHPAVPVPAAPPVLPTAVAERPAGAEAAFQFALAKVLTEEGSLAAARSAFEQAVRLAGDDPYLRTEYAELLRRLASRSRQATERAELLAEAVRQAEAAAALAPDNADVLRALAQTHLALADGDPRSLTAAIAALERVRRLTPWDLQAMIPLGQIYLQQGRPERAAEVFAEAADHTPDSRIVFSMLADALRAAGRDADAAAALERLLALDPAALEARVSLARLYARGDDPARAVAVLRAAPDAVRDAPELTGELAWQLYRSEDFEGALAAAEASLAADPENRWLRLVHALALGGLGRTGEALDGITELRAGDPENLELVRAAAGLLERDGQAEEAARLYQDLLGRLDGGEAGRPLAERARLLLAGVQARSGRGEEAITTLGPVLASADPELRRDAAIAYADLLHEAGRTGEALAVLRRGDAPELAVKEIDLLLAAGERGKARRLARKLLEIQPPEILLLAAQTAQQREEYALAIPLLERVLETSPADRGARFLLGAALERGGRHQEAASAFERLLATEPDFAPALNYLGYMWAERGENLARALELVQRAVALDPDNGAYVDSLGWAHFQLGELDLAREHLERAVDLLPDDATIWEHLADVYAALGEVDKARDLYRRALAAGDGDGDRAELRRKLDGLSVRQ
jgi:tetratricopeptide (TPR) repeat protein